MKAKKLLALVLALTFIFSAFSINAYATVVDTDGGMRLYGDNRYETAIEIADTMKTTVFGDKDYKTIIIAYGRNYADALAGSYLAALTGAPILIVNTDKNNQNDYFSVNLVKSYINQNLAKGGKIYVLGGTAVISNEFVDSLKTSDRTVKRLAGANRYETNIAILKECLKYERNPDEILICDAYGFADALSCSSLGMPILLVDKQGQKLTDVQKDYLKDLGLDDAYIIGGTAAVPSAIEKAMKNYCDTKRIYGQNRYETSVKIADEFFDDDELRVVTAYGHDFPDGLCGGPLAYNTDAPLILVYNDSAASGTNLYSAKQYFVNNDIIFHTILGGVNAVTENTQKTLDAFVDLKSDSKDDKKDDKKDNKKDNKKDDKKDDNNQPSTDDAEKYMEMLQEIFEKYSGQINSFDDLKKILKDDYNIDIDTLLENVDYTEILKMFQQNGGSNFLPSSGSDSNSDDLLGQLGNLFSGISNN